MDKLDFDANEVDTKPVDSQEMRKFGIQRCLQTLCHASRCKGTKCRLPHCQKAKKVVAHIKICKRRSRGGCPVCKHLVELCYHHSKNCQEAKCSVPFCLSIRKKLNELQVFS